MKPLNQITTADLIEFAKGVDPKTWIKIGIGAAIFALLYFFILSPAWFKRPEVHQKILATETQIVGVKNAMRKRPEWIREQETFQKFIKDSKERIYAPGESSLLLGMISKLAEESKVTVVASKPKMFDGKLPVPFDKEYEANAYDFTLEGGYHEIGSFISKIESNPKLLRVQSFTVRSREEDPKKHLIDLSLSAVSFKQRKA